MKARVQYGRCRTGAYKGLYFVTVWLEPFGTVHHSFCENGPQKAQMFQEQLQGMEILPAEEIVETKKGAA